MSVVELLDQGFDWTAARVAAVRPEHLESATPCADWHLRHLLRPTSGALTVLTDAVSGEARRSQSGRDTPSERLVASLGRTP